MAAAAVTGDPAEIVESWLADPRVAVVTFTGSSRVGWDLKARSPRKLHVLELGSNTAMVVTDSADLFGPVASILTVDDLDAAIDAVNSSEFALNTAVHTSDLAEALAFADRAEAGSVLVNMPPSYRADHMPYGGVKASGQGTEGVKYAIDELLHHKLVVLKP